DVEHHHLTRLIHRDEQTAAVARDAHQLPLLFQLLGEAILAGMIAFLLYLAVEPYFRRRWPKLLIGWTRLLSGRFRDPMVGRDVLIGTVVGTACAIVSKAPYFILPPFRTSFTALPDLRHLLSMVLYST